MNFSLYLLGNPSGYNQYPSDANNAKFQSEVVACRTESRLSVFRNNQLIQYVYVRKVSGNNGLYLGFTLVFTSVYCIDCHPLNNLFDDAFYDVLLKGELLRFQKDKYSYQVSKFADNANEIKRINLFFKTRLDNELNGLFVPIPTSFRTGNGEHTLSLNETAADINAAIELYDIVHLTNDEKSVSELERTQQMLSALYAEHGELRKKYRKVLSQKRNFKTVVILSLILLGCVLGFFLLNNVLMDNNFTIIQQLVDIRAKSEKITTLSKEKQQLTDSIQSLEKSIQIRNDSIQTLNKDIINLQNKVEQLETSNGELQTDVNLAKEQLKELLGLK